MKKWKNIIDQYIASGDRNIEEPNEFTFNQCQLKVALGVCFALKSWKEYLLLFTYLITLGKDVTLLLITKFKTNRHLSNLFVNRIPN